MTISKVLLFILFIFFCTISIQGTRAKALHLYHNNGDSSLEQIKSRRSMIGSTAPTCTYNECRGCRYRCRAEQVPVDANDPANSAYHYRCVCHKW
ncbi:hypothetical protein IHE45_10G032500 [Dioscorea alata]|uniref:Uncharacterized protein n=1 Tax=Dioscorea alata TaxID=55571 RepID=A0ACB7VA67_DIOAL|nr:hypothetical protein IHE45_10G032500 [Dioscorea alata]